MVKILISLVHFLFRNLVLKLWNKFHILGGFGWGIADAVKSSHPLSCLL